MPLITGWCRKLLVLAALLLVPQAGAAQSVTLDIATARAVAEQAVLTGNPVLARQIALGLLQRDNADIGALLTLATAEVLLGNPSAARKAAVRAFRATRDSGARYEAARLAAKAGFEQGRLTLAQLWLRRALDSAPDAATWQDTVAGFRQVQAQNRWRTRLQFSAAPSSNVNQGSSAGRLIINGVPTILSFSGDAMALSGLTYGITLGTGYVIGATAQSRTELGAQLVVNGVVMSDQARRQAPGASNADYAYQAAELTLTHQFQPRTGALPMAATVLAGANWYGGKPLTSYARAQLDFATPLQGPQRLGWQVLAERQWPQDGSDPLTVLALNGSYQRQLTSGDRAGLQIGVVSQSSANANSGNLALTAAVSYALARPVGPAQVSFSLSATSRDYPVFFSNQFNLDGRRDLKVGVTLDLAFPKAQVMGFAPTLSLSASHTGSNVSRFEQDAFGVQFGLKSLF